MYTEFLLMHVRGCLNPPPAENKRLIHSQRLDHSQKNLQPRWWHPAGRASSKFISPPRNTKNGQRRCRESFTKKKREQQQRHHLLSGVSPRNPKPSQTKTGQARQSKQQSQHPCTHPCTQMHPYTPCTRAAVVHATPPTPDRHPLAGRKQIPAACTPPIQTAAVVSPQSIEPPTT